MTVKSGIVAGVVLALAWGAVGSGEAIAEAEPAAAESALISAVMVRDVQALLRDAGALVSEAQYDTKDEFKVVATFDDGLIVVFRGMACGHYYEGVKCPEYRMTTTFTLDSPEQAARLAREIQTFYVEADARENTLILSRMGFTYGGVTRAHQKQTIEAYLMVVRGNRDQIDPASADPTRSR